MLNARDRFEKRELTTNSEQYRKQRKPASSSPPNSEEHHYSNDNTCDFGSDRIEACEYQQSTNETAS